MEKEQTSKSLGKNLLVAFVVLIAWFLLIRVGTSFASKNSFEIIDAEISTKSPYVEISDFNFEKGNIASNVVFHKVGDSVTYKLKMKNTDDTEYIIKSVSDDNKNDHVSYTYGNYVGKKVNAQEEFTFELTEKYALENNDVSNRNQNLSVILTFEIEDQNGNSNETIIPINPDENIPEPVFPITGGDTNAEVYHVTDGDTVVKVSPKTGDNIVLYVAIFVAAIGLLIVAIRKRNVLEVTEKTHKPHGVKRLKILSFFVIVGAALFPTISRALANTSITFTSIISFKDKLVVTYKVNGETFEKVVPYESKIELDDPEVPGYKFARWEDKDGNKFDSETPITNDLELTAIFNPIEYTLAYELNDGIVDPENPTTYTIESADVSLTKPTKNGYKFTGWTGTGLEDKTENVTIAKGSMENREYTANWTANTYTIVFNANTAEGSMENESMTYDVSKTLTANTFTKEDHKFTGWNTKADGSGTSYNDKESVINLATDGEIILYAQWQELAEYTVTFDATSEGTLTQNTKTIREGKKVGELPKPTPKQEDYRFVAWYTDQTFTTKVTEDTVINGDVTFYAKYKYYMSTVFSVTEEVKFNGKDHNIESTDTRFVNSDYIDTGIALFTETNIKKDFEISFEIVSYNPAENAEQATFVASKYEKKSLNYPGFVFRRQNKTDNVEMTARVKASGNGTIHTYDSTTVQKVTIIRKHNKIYHKVNDGNLKEVCNMQDLFDRELTFGTTVTFGATVDENNVSMRHFTGTLKNMIIKLED